MLTNLALIIFLAFVLYLVFERLTLPGLLGFILTGFLVGSHGLQLIHPKIIDFSSELKTLALIIILLRAGLALQIKELQRMKGQILLASFLPLFVEMMVQTTFLHFLFSFSLPMAILTSCILSPVAPAVIIPKMLALKDDPLFKNKAIPQVLLSANTLDNIFALTFFGIFLGIAKGENRLSFLTLFNIPLSMGLGIAVGLGLGLLSIKFFKTYRIRDTKKTILILFLCVFLKELENHIPFASYLAIISFGLTLLFSYEVLAHRLSQKFSKIWILAELLLFVLIGTQVSFTNFSSYALLGIALIFAGLSLRSLSFFLCLPKGLWTRRERLFSTFSFMPKASIQAALGAIPLALGLPQGELILLLSTLSIVFSILLSNMLTRFSKPQ